MSKITHSNRVAPEMVPDDCGAHCKNQHSHSSLFFIVSSSYLHSPTKSLGGSTAVKTVGFEREIDLGGVSVQVYVHTVCMNSCTYDARSMARQVRVRVRALRDSSKTSR